MSSSYAAWWAKQGNNKVGPRFYNNYNHITENLFVGACPYGARLNDFDYVVLCAEEFQPKNIVGCKNIIRCPLRDFDLDLRAIVYAEGVAKDVAQLVKDGKKVLICCMGGLDRSAMVCALVLYYMHGVKMTRAADYVKAKRPGALCDIQYDWLALAYDGRHTREEKQRIIDTIMYYEQQKWEMRMVKLKKQAEKDKK